MSQYERNRFCSFIRVCSSKTSTLWRHWWEILGQLFKWLRFLRQTEFFNKYHWLQISREMLLRFSSGKKECVIQDVYYKELQKNNRPNCPFKGSTNFSREKLGKIYKEAPPQGGSIPEFPNDFFYFPERYFDISSFPESRTKSFPNSRTILFIFPNSRTKNSPIPEFPNPWGGGLLYDKNDSVG